MWHDLLDVRLAEARDDRASIRLVSRPCGARAHARAHRVCPVPRRAGAPRAGPALVSRPSRASWMRARHHRPCPRRGRAGCHPTRRIRGRAWRQRLLGLQAAHLAPSTMASTSISPHSSRGRASTCCSSAASIPTRARRMRSAWPARLAGPSSLPASCRTRAVSSARSNRGFRQTSAMHEVVAGRPGLLCRAATRIRAEQFFDVRMVEGLPGRLSCVHVGTVGTGSAGAVRCVAASDAR